MSPYPVDQAGRRCSPATLPGYHVGRTPPNKGRTYPADPPTVDEIVAVMRQAGTSRHGLCARADRRPVALGASHPRSARAQRDRSRPEARERDRYGG